MRKSRLTWVGAYHHVMNRGIAGEAIFRTDNDKRLFINILKEKRKIFKIRIFAYCIMDNHYHLVIENTTGKMSDLFRQVNGQYGIHYRKKYGGKGYVFQDRYKSTLIENDQYLMHAILYVILNPEKDKIVKNCFDYKWSSINLYFSETRESWIENNFIEEMYGNREDFRKVLKRNPQRELNGFNTKLGPILGSRNFYDEALKIFNRRIEPDGNKKKREEDFYFEPVEKVIWEFEKRYRTKIDEINIYSYHGKRLRGELLVWLKDQAGLKYSEIIEFPIFTDLRLNSLGHLYKNAKKRIN